MWYHTDERLMLDFGLSVWEWPVSIYRQWSLQNKKAERGQGFKNDSLEHNVLYQERMKRQHQNDTSLHLGL